MVQRVGLFIPCYMDAFEPEVGIATLELLERLGCTVDYPFDQTCCGQPMVNTGCHREAAATEKLFVANFAGYDYIVCPSGSCAHQVRANLTAIEQTAEVRRVRANIYELTEFLHDVLKVDALPWARFPHKVGIHYNCNSLRGIGLASPSELRETAVFETEGPAVARRRHRIRRAVAARRVLRVWRHVLRLRARGFRQDGLRQGRRSCESGRRIQRLRQFLLPASPERVCRPDRHSAEVHPHRPHPQRSRSVMDAAARQRHCHASRSPGVRSSGRDVVSTRRRPRKGSSHRPSISRCTTRMSGRFASTATTRATP